MLGRLCGAPAAAALGRSLDGLLAEMGDARGDGGAAQGALRGLAELRGAAEWLHR